MERVLGEVSLSGNLSGMDRICFNNIMTLFGSDIEYDKTEGWDGDTRFVRGGVTIEGPPELVERIARLYWYVADIGNRVKEKEWLELVEVRIANESDWGSIIALDPGICLDNLMIVGLDSDGDIRAVIALVGVGFGTAIVTNRRCRPEDIPRLLALSPFETVNGYVQLGVEGMVDFNLTPLVQWSWERKGEGIGLIGSETRIERLED